MEIEKHKMFIFLILLAIAVAKDSSKRVVLTRNCPRADRDDLLGCLAAHVDGNEDGNLTVTELNYFIGNQTIAGNLSNATAYTAILNGSAIMTLCDRNSDGILSNADWTNATGCLRSLGSQMFVCELCFKIGWTGAPLLLKKRK